MGVCILHQLFSFQCIEQKRCQNWMHARRWRHAPARHSALVTLLLRRCVQDLSVRTRLSANLAASRSMLRESPEDGASASAPRVHRSLSLTGLSSTTSSCWWATLASIVAAPILLWCTPSRHPIGETRIAVVGRGGGAGRSATGALPRAALSMHPAAPLLLAHRPSNHPVGEAISTIVRVGRRSWHHGCYWHWHWHWHRHWDWLRASDVMDPAAPRLLVCLPPVRCVHCAVERVDWTDRPRRLCRALRQRPWRGWRGRGWRGWRRCRRRSGLLSCWCLGGAADSACLAAVLLLRWRPHHCCCRDRCSN